jgi:ABC-type uncharacterized transport system permease subunit
MLGLPIPEIIIFAFVIALYLAAAIVGILQLPAGGEKYKRFLLPLISLAVTLEAVMLIFRAVEIKAVPLTGLFESMIVLTIVFGLIYLFFSIAIQQVWFGSVMVWVIFGLIILAAIVAEPASEAHAAAATPWAIAHGIAMILAGVATMLATASALLYLLGRRKLKQKKVMQVLGKVPNFEKLEHMNLLGLKACFAGAQGLFCPADIWAGQWNRNGCSKLSGTWNTCSCLAGRLQDRSYYSCLDAIRDNSGFAALYYTKGQEGGVRDLAGLLFDCICDSWNHGFLWNKARFRQGQRPDG